VDPAELEAQEVTEPQTMAAEAAVLVDTQVMAALVAAEPTLVHQVPEAALVAAAAESTTLPEVVVVSGY
jgi:hypothetical protein